MVTRYTLLLNNHPEDAHVPAPPDGELIQHIVIETDLPQGEVVKRLTDLALAMDAARDGNQPA